MEHRYDVAVLGGGAAGLAAAAAACRLGVSVCLIEKAQLGGECTWDGCIPSKTLLRSAEVAHLVRTSGRFGLALPQGASPDPAGVFDHVRSAVRAIHARETAEALAGRGIRVLTGEARFADKTQVRVDGDVVRAARFIVATGSRPLIPPVAGLEGIEVLTNESLFALTAPPPTLLILGGGPVGVEMAQAFARLGTAVTLVEAADQILPQEEDDLTVGLAERLLAEGVRVLTGRKTLEAGRADDPAGGVRLVVKDVNHRRAEITAHRILVATGRVPDTANLNLEAAGVEETRDGIVADEFLQTRNERIFACGDVVGPFRFTNMARYQAAVCVRNALFRRVAWERTDYDRAVWSLFTDPELAHLGWTEEEARDARGQVTVYRSDYAESDRSFTRPGAAGRIKVIADRSGRILGAHLLGPRASEVVQAFVLARHLDVPLGDLAGMITVYPTYGELVKKMAERAAQGEMEKPLAKLALDLLEKI